LAHSINAKLILSIGSGSGQHLQMYREEGITVIGIEPSDYQASISRDLGIDTFSGYLTETVVDKILAKYGQVDMVLVDNATKMPHPVHISNVNDPLTYVDNISNLVKSNGLVYVRTPYIGSIMTFGLLDYVYHEHQSYFSCQSIRRLFSRVGLQILHAGLCKYDSLHAEFLFSPHPNVSRGENALADFENKERCLKLEEKSSFSSIAGVLQASKTTVRQALGDCHGLTIAGYGASTATVSSMYQYEIASDLNFLVDDDETKIGLYSPNANLRVERVDKIYTRKTEVLVILTSRFADRIKENHRNFSGQILAPSLNSGRGNRHKQ